MTAPQASADALEALAARAALLFRFDNTGYCTYVSPHAASVLGQPAMQGRSWVARAPFDSPCSEWTTAMGLALQGQASTIQLTHAQPGGAPLAFQCQFVPEADERQDIHHVLVVAHDITTLRRTNDTLARAFQSLLEARRTADRHLPTLSHEFRTPLTVVRNAAAILSKPGSHVTAEDHTRFARLIVESTRQLDRVLDDLLGPATNREEADMKAVEPWDLREVAKDIVREFAPLLTPKCIELRLVLGAEPSVVAAPPQRLGLLLMNLIVSAAEATPQDGTITVRVGLAGHEIVMTVQHGGPGLAADELARLFEAAPRLALCKQIVEEDLYGRIWAESLPGAGNTYGVALHVIDLDSA